MCRWFQIGILVALAATLGCGVSSTSTIPLPGTAPSSAKANGGEAGPGEITPDNTQITWIGRKPEGKHDGGFNKFTGRITPITDDLTGSTITLEIDTDSLYSDNEKLTSHLKAPDFFEVKKYPTAKFVSKEIKEKKDGDNTHTITGDLTLHGTTKPITFPAKVTMTDKALTLESEFTFDRTEYGIAFDPEKVDREVTVKVSSQVARK